MPTYIPKVEFEYAIGTESPVVLIDGTHFQQWREPLQRYLEENAMPAKKTTVATTEMTAEDVKKRLKTVETQVETLHSAARQFEDHSEHDVFSEGDIANIVYETLDKEGFDLRNRTVADLVTEAIDHDDIAERIVEAIDEHREHPLVEAVLKALEDGGNTPLNAEQIAEHIGDDGSCIGEAVTQAIQAELENYPDEDRVNELIGEYLEWTENSITRDEVHDIFSDRIGELLGGGEELTDDTRLVTKTQLTKLLDAQNAAIQKLTEQLDKHVKAKEEREAAAWRNEQEARCYAPDYTVEAKSAGYRIAARQVTALVHAPVSAAIAAHTDADLAKLIMASDFGKAAVGGLLSAGAEYVAEAYDGLNFDRKAQGKQLAKELRINAAVVAGNLVTQVLVGEISTILKDAFTEKVRVEIPATIMNLDGEELEIELNEKKKVCHG